jgi:hypothetical protein
MHGNISVLRGLLCNCVGENPSLCDEYVEKAAWILEGISCARVGVCTPKEPDGVHSVIVKWPCQHIALGMPASGRGWVCIY